MKEKKAERYRQLINHRGGNLLEIREGLRQYFITQMILCWDGGVTFILLVGWRRRYGPSMLESPLLLKYITGGNQILLDKRIWLLMIFQLMGIRVEEILYDEEKEKGEEEEQNQLEREIPLCSD